MERYEEFDDLIAIEKFILLVKLIKKFPGKRGSDYSDLLNQIGYVNVDKTSVNRYLYSMPKAFSPNLNEKQVPAWTYIGNQYLNEDIEISSDSIVQDAVKYQRNVKQNDPSTFFDVFSTVELYEWQSNAIKSWRDENYNGYAIAARRTGKTFLARLIAYDHALQVGPVIVAVNTIAEIDSWVVWVERTNKKHDQKVKIGRYDASRRDGLEQNTILIGTVSSLSRTKFKHDQVLLIIEHLELLGSSFGDLLNIKYAYRLGFSNEKPTKKYLETDTNLPYFKKELIRYTLTEAMLEDKVQNFKLSFIRCKDSELYSGMEKVKNELYKEFPEFVTKKNIDIYVELDKWKSKGYAVDSIEEFIRNHQNVYSKLEYLEGQVSRFQQNTRSVVFCETPEFIFRIHDFFELKGINHIIYSSNSMLSDLSQSPHHWENEKVLVTDHIKYMTNFDFEVIDYALILGATGSSKRLTQNIETVISDRFVDDVLDIEVLVSKNTFEDPFFDARAYAEYKDYVSVDQIKEEAKPKLDGLKKLESSPALKSKVIINLETAKVLFVVPGDLDHMRRTLSEIIEDMEIHGLEFEIQDLSHFGTIDQMLETIKTSVYSDVFILLNEDDDFIADLNRFDSMKTDVNIVKKITDKSDLSSILKFIYDSRKYRQIDEKRRPS